MKEKNGQHTPVLQIRCFAKTIKMEEIETFGITLRQCLSQNKLAFTTVQNSPEGRKYGSTTADWPSLFDLNFFVQSCVRGYLVSRSYVPTSCP
jgi:hypothetical protein